MLLKSWEKSRETVSPRKKCSFDAKIKEILTVWLNASWKFCIQLIKRSNSYSPPCSSSFPANNLRSSATSSMRRTSSLHTISSRAFTLPWRSFPSSKIMKETWKSRKYSPVRSTMKAISSCDIRREGRSRWRPLLLGSCLSATFSAKNIDHMHLYTQSLLEHPRQPQFLHITSFPSSRSAFGTRQMQVVL